MTLPLTVVDPPVSEELRTFGSEARPLRPSRVAKFLACPMSVILVMHEEREGGVAAQTGNLVHDAAEAFHKHARLPLEERVALGLAALEAARVEFPEGNPEKGREIFRAYAADKENIEAEVLWCEEPVRLVLAADPGDPTGAPIVIQGTLDQVRRHRDRVLRVWDIKTGEYLTGDESVLEYLTQQAVYTLAARATLNPEIEPGGLIYTPGYAKVRGRVHLDNPLTVDQCEDLLLLLPSFVSLVRQGKPVFRPGKEACRFCDVKKMGRAWPKCRQMYRGVYGR